MVRCVRARGVREREPAMLCDSARGTVGFARIVDQHVDVTVGRQRLAATVGDLCRGKRGSLREGEGQPGLA